MSDEGFAELASEILGRGHSLRFRAHGQSMRPSIRDGDVLTAEPADLAELRVGDVALHQTGRGQVVAHRVIARRTSEGDTVLITCGDGSGRSMDRATEEQVLGRVVAVERKGRTRRLRRSRGMLWAGVSIMRWLWRRALHRT